MFPFYDKREPRCFNTSHVTLYRQKKKLLLLRLIGFNTSHVTLYPCPDCCNRKSDQCFNTSHVTLYLSLQISYIIKKIRFNTSHVTLYQEEREIREDKEEVSIHLMLLFIGYKIGNYCFFRLFQYISCYSLSWILSYEGRKVLGFNTSHVTLYQKMFEKEIDEI